MQTVTFETYAPMFIDYEDYIENENYDNEIRVFSVPKALAVDWIFIHYRMGYEDFLNEYTWDDTFNMFGDAIKDKVLVNCDIEDR